ncbi:sensor histidine kinase [Neobacillus kokaensis]|uniref:Histidine kinase n=1 Tax=Neobacillus kokaensis TaxID=2759023 RepID=A0ABQ3N8N1_9BACI|nr:histidine kinase [Neobacillus kokaensis]GHI00028.1 histidine kinase [Neobacillus kokaensis]
MIDTSSKQKYGWFHSLKNRLIVILLLSSFIPIFLIGFISYDSISTLQDHKMRSGIQNDLQKIKITLEGNLENLNHVSQQLAFGGGVGNDLYTYLTNNSVEKVVAERSIKEKVGFIGSSNPNISLMLYYNIDKKSYMFQNYPVRDHFSLSQLPVLVKEKEITIYGPHQTESRIFNNYVLSISRKVKFPHLDNIYIYIETNNEFLSEIFQNSQYGKNIDYLIVNKQGIITYSENQRYFPIGSSYKDSRKQDSHQYAFSERSNQGWEIVALIGKKIYEKESRSWFIKFILFAIASLCISLLFVWWIWRTVYRPLNRIRRAILTMNNEKNFEIKLTGLIEFDTLIHQFNQMKTKIGNLLNDIRESEKKKTRLEVEKLLLQINPHFIHNTLDTFRWKARLTGQEEMDRLLSQFGRLIHYNLRRGETATIKEELEALNDYMELQGIRYNIKFNISIHVDDSTLETPIPRFILQPIVENALYHGIGHEGIIKVDIRRQDEAHIIIKVIDSGGRIEDESIRQLLNDAKREQKNAGLGIGMQYVLRMIEYQYGEEASCRIESDSVRGTEVILILPVKEKEDSR